MPRMMLRLNLCKGLLHTSTFVDPRGVTAKEGPKMGSKARPNPPQCHSQSTFVVTRRSRPLTFRDLLLQALSISCLSSHSSFGGRKKVCTRK